MILTKPSFKIEKIVGDLEFLEECARTCYKSHNPGDKDLTERFIKGIISSGHGSVIEHSMITVRFIVDRGVSHELVRHRLASFSQESTRYVNYKGGCEFIIPPWVSDKIVPGEYDWWDADMINKLAEEVIEEDYFWIDLIGEAESVYQSMIDGEWTPQQARSVLPNSTKTEIVMTSNFRHWREIFRQRTSKAAHPQMREVMIPLLAECKSKVPIIFDDIEVK